MAKEYFVVSHWSTLIDNLEEAPTNFYKLVEASIEERKIPDLRFTQTEMKESGIFSAKRLYLTVERKQYSYDICGAPFGRGFFVSTWLSYSMGFCQTLLLKIPVIGGLFAPAIGDVTFYQRDTTDMFHTFVHDAVLSTVDRLLTTKGRKALPEAERKPVMSEFYKPRSLKR